MLSSDRLDTIPWQLSTQPIVGQVIRGVVLALVFTASSSVVADEQETIHCRDESACKETFLLVYTLDDFASSRPHTAFDVIELVPGFRVADDANVRGLGASAGNVLINGSHPASKGGGVRDALSRIPAKSIDRIEVRHASSMPGQTSTFRVIANIITRDAEKSWSWTAAIEQAPGRNFYPALETTRTGQFNTWGFDVRLGALLERLPSRGSVDDFDRDDQLSSAYEERRISRIVDAFVSAGIENSRPDGATKWSMRLDDQQFEPSVIRKNRDGSQPGNRIDSSSRIKKVEISGSWYGKMSPRWELRMTALGSIADDEFESRRSSLLADNQELTSSFLSESTHRELVMRNTAAHQLANSRLNRIGVEIAYNEVDAKLSFGDIGDPANGVEYRPFAKSVVDEIRSELFSVWQFELAPRLQLEAEANFEHSRISVSGDSTRRETLSYFKPSVVLTYTHSLAAQVQWSIRQYVSQLSFDDFAAHADFVQDRDTVGNAQLRPDRGTRAEATFRYQWSDKTILSASLFHEWQRDVLEYTVVPGGFEGIANAGDATRWGGKASVSVDLSSILPGAIAHADFATEDSRYRDPLAGENRVRTDTRRPIANFRVRQDIPGLNLAWGFRYVMPSTQRRFFVAEEQLIERGRILSAFAEYDRNRSTKFRLDITSLGRYEQQFDRAFYDPARGHSYTGARKSGLTAGPYVRISVSRQF